jgi:tryptophanase
MYYMAVALKNIFDRRNEITKGYRITWESPILRHFTVKLEEA